MAATRLHITEIMLLAYNELQRKIDILEEKQRLIIGSLALDEKVKLPVSPETIKAAEAEARNLETQDEPEADKPLRVGTLKEADTTVDEPEKIELDQTKLEADLQQGRDPDGAKKFDEAIAEYDAGPKATASQGKMLFAMLKSDFAITDGQEAKGVIRGWWNESHPEQPIKSTKDLDKAQAGDLITWLKDEATAADVRALADKWTEPF